MKINLNELLLSFSLLLDIAENRPFQHSKRVAYIAMQIILKLKKTEFLSLTFQAAILHDIGMTHSILLNGREIFYKEETVSVTSHSKTGYEIVKALPIEDEIAEIIKYHHERWDGSGVEKYKEDEIPFLAQVVALADYVELNYDRRQDNLHYRNEFRSMLEKEKGVRFNPELTDVLLTLLQQEKLWLDLGVYDIHSLLLPLIPTQAIKIGIDELEQISKAFAVIIDKKSAFTHHHSEMISDRAYKMAKALGYDELKCRKMRISGYLHDVGKLIISNEILDKPEKLTNEEMMVIKKHPYYSKFILKQIKGFEEIAEWGPNHHENLLGTGYPEGLSGEMFTEEAQVMAICDIYQALIEDRIYRAGMSRERALEILSQLVDKGYYKRYILEHFIEINHV
ncbi:metal dependent phosphohydrolase [Alkaliphilus metalliredigens QYMF]|uniref:Metal dependent phosphohydrolase n=1 Tax=Alkaliphilus metalliredigens (strain QYMF) TaxID=293826 RepID=A6TTA2_ALKMQ|nr:HD domain-containing phosphohydrolase [Alkaliphilus metalliredigens]ABR49420.1 metal dependent phosphohydrolase [Alkaliphilus metalliredigens QYMF]